jgi:predicted nuclease of predicted toxin-antitoxin system
VPSKKLSDVKPPDGTVFFIDRSLGIEPVRGQLTDAGLSVEIHDDHFVRDEEDRVWLQHAGEVGWVVLTKDQRLRYRPLEIAALRNGKVRVFVLTAGNLRGVEIGEVFLAALPEICKVLSKHEGPFLARISKSGRVTLTDPAQR